MSWLQRTVRAWSLAGLSIGCGGPSPSEEVPDVAVSVAADASAPVDASSDAGEPSGASGDASVPPPPDAADVSHEEVAEADVAPLEGETSEGSGDVASRDAAAPEFEAPPELTRVFPDLVAQGGVIYLTGNHLVARSGDTALTEVWLVSEAGARLNLRVADVTLLGGTVSRVAAVTPPDLADTLGTSGELFVGTPAGQDAHRPVHATRNNTFSGKTPLGAGLLGNVYRIAPTTSRLPDLRTSPCTQPAIISDAGTPCPWASVVTSQLAIPPTSYTSGFPGLGGSLVEWFAIGFEGHILIPTSGEWRFRLCSDDGGKLYTGEGGAWVPVADIDGQHPMRCADSLQPLSLEQGALPIFVEYYQGPREQIALELRWRGPDMADFTLVPAEALRLFAD